jgi:hypothetical protein
MRGLLMDNVSVRLAIGMSLVVAFALVVFEGRAATAPMDLVFVASDQTAFHELSVEDIQNVYFGKKRMVGGQPVVAVDQSETAPIKQDFLNHVIHMTQAQYREQLLKRRFQEGAVIPKVVANSEETLKAVRETPGTIGYVHEFEVGTMLGLKVVATVPTK